MSPKTKSIADVRVTESAQPPHRFPSHHAQVLLAYRRGDKDKADQLRCGVVKLGVVFVKLAQTLATRPDIIGDEAADALGILQDDNPPFADAVAYGVIADDLGWSGPVSPCHQRMLRDGGLRYDESECLFPELTESPIAAASIAQVHASALCALVSEWECFAGPGLGKSSFRPSEGGAGQ